VFRDNTLAEQNPCISCGACCAHFRASFYWSEAEPAAGGTVPPEMVDKLNDRFVVMKGTNSDKPYCIALEGKIGEQVGCNIYPLRSGTCREFPYSWQDGEHNPRCDQARLAWGLPPLAPPAGMPTDIPMVAELTDPELVANDSRPVVEPPEDPHPDQPGPPSPKAA